MHLHPHLDEIAAYVLLYLSEALWGIKLFPGFCKASIRFVESGVSGTNEEFDRRGNVLIGVGAGDKLCADKTASRFDEHRADGQHGRLVLNGRVTCSTELVAEYLEITDKPEVNQLVEEVRWCDNTHEAPPGCLAEIIKAMHRSSPGHQGSLLVLFWALKVIDSIIICKKFGYAAGANEVSLAKLFTMAAGETMQTQNHRVMHYVQKHLGKTNRHKKPLTLTEPGFMAAAVQRRGYALETTAGNVSDWYREAVIAMVNDQIAFQEDYQFLKGVPFIRVSAILNGRHKDLRLMAFQSDSSRIEKVARYTGADLVLIRNSSGNICISIRSQPGLSLKSVTRMIRWLELPNEEKDTDWYELGMIGNHPLVPKWYYFEMGQKLFCGSFTHVEEGTSIHFDALVDVMRHGFHPQGVRIWKNARNIKSVPRLPERASRNGSDKHPRNRLQETQEPVAASTTRLVEKAFKKARKPSKKKTASKKSGSKRK